MKLWKSSLALCPLLVLALLLPLQMAPSHGASMGESRSNCLENVFERKVTLKGNSPNIKKYIKDINPVKLGLGLVKLLLEFGSKFFGDHSLDDKSEIEKKLLYMFEDISQRLEELNQETAAIAVNIRDLSKGLPYMLDWKITLNTLQNYMDSINNNYYLFTSYQKQADQMEESTLMDFVHNVLSHSTNSIQSLMASVHCIAAPGSHSTLHNNVSIGQAVHYAEDRVTNDITMVTFKLVESNPKLTDKITKESYKELVYPVLRPNIFIMLKNVIENYKDFNFDYTPQQFVFSLYSLIAVTLARGYGMINFSYFMLRIKKQGNFTAELQLAERLYLHYSKTILENAVDVMTKVSNAHRTHDPNEHMEGQTFEMVTELLQGYIENEVDLNDAETCGYDCAHYKRTAVKGCYLPKTEYCGKDPYRCGGQVYDCRFIESFSTICASRLPYRRYDWIEYNSGRKFGQGTRNMCKKITRADSWLRGFYQCSYCFCLCDDANSSTSDRFISLRPVVSDITKGMIVTGVKFTKKNRIIYAQIQQGKALPNGNVDSNTVHWINVEDMSVGTKKFIENVDYATFNYTTRNIDLDRLIAPIGHVVTGVQFRLLRSHVKLQVSVTPVNFTTGVLSSNSSFWLSSNDSVRAPPRSEVVLTDPKDPRRAVSESVVDSVDNMYVTLQPTSVTSDVAQLTVPFFDAQPVTLSILSWLQGIELYHRGFRGYGGFIGFKIFNYNITYNLKKELDMAQYSIHE